MMKTKLHHKKIGKLFFPIFSPLRKVFTALFILCAFHFSAMATGGKCIKSVTIAASQTLCQGASANALTVSIQTEGFGSSVSPTYKWYSNAVNNNTTGTLISGATASTYTPPTITAGILFYYCVVINNNGHGTCSGGSSVSNTVMITITASPTTANAGSDQTVCGTTATLAGNTAIIGTGTWTLVSGTGTITSPNSPNSGVTGLGIGTNIFRWKIVNGTCSSQDEVKIIRNSLPNVNAGSDKMLTCATTTVTLQGSSSTNGATFSWATIGGNIVTGGSTATPTVNAAGTYILTVTHPNGCTANDTAMVSLNVTLPNVNAGSDKTLTCLVTSVMLNGSSSTGGATFSWTTNDGNIVSGSTNATATVNAAGTYTLTVTNPVNGCQASDVVVVILDNTAPDVNAGIDKTITCASASVTLNGSSSTQGVVYSWTTINGNIVSGANSATATVDAAGSYTLTVTNPATGCEASDVVTVTVDHVLPDANAGTDKTLTCAVLQVSLDGSSTTAGATFSWAATNGGAILSGGNTATPVVQVPGRYILTVTNPVNGCTAVDSADVFQDINAPDVDAGADKTLTCLITSVTLNGSTSTPGTTYLWTTIDGSIVNGAATLSAVVNASGTYMLTVTNTISGCQASDAVTVILNNTPPEVNAGADMTLTCEDTSVILHGSCASGVMFNWTTNNGNIVSGSSTAMATVNAAGSYTLTVTDSYNGCIGYDSVKVFLNITPPDVHAGADTLINCINTPITLHGSSQALHVSFSWTTTNGNIVSGPNTAHPVVSAAGMYVLTVTDSINGCSASDTVMVGIDIPPVVDLGNDTTLVFCAGHLTLDAGNPGMTYLWSTGATTQTIHVSATGTYYVHVISSGGCLASDTIHVVVNPGTISVDLGNDTTIVTCTHDSLMITAGNQGAFYSWSTGATTQTIWVDETGDYYVTVTDSKGCTASDTIHVVIYGRIDLDFGPDTTICGCITLNAYVSGGSYKWCSGGTYPSKEVCQTGMYCVTVTNGVCTVSDTIHITVKDAPMVDLGNDTTFESGELALDAGNAGVSFWWNTGDTTRVITVNSSGQYIVVVTDMNGCTATDTINVNVLNGIAENTKEDFHLNVYPNPGNGSDLTLSFEIAERGDVEVRIMNMIGLVIYSEKLDNFQGLYKKKLGLENPAAGIYVADILKGSQRSAVKLVVE